MAQMYHSIPRSECSAFIDDSTMFVERPEGNSERLHLAHTYNSYIAEVATGERLMHAMLTSQHCKTMLNFSVHTHEIHPDSVYTTAFVNALINSLFLYPAPFLVCLYVCVVSFLVSIALPRS